MGKGHSFTGYPERAREGDLLSYDPEIEYSKLIAERRDQKRFHTHPKGKHRSKRHSKDLDLDIDPIFEEEDLDQLYEV